MQQHKDGIEKCDFLHAHTQTVARVRGKLPTDEALMELSELFYVFGDSTRIRILYALHESELCVCDIAKLLGMTLSAISHQLRILRTAKLVESRREGKTVFYRLSDGHVHTILGQGMEHIMEEKGDARYEKNI